MPNARGGLTGLHGLYVLLRLAINPRYSARAGPRAAFSRERSASTDNR